MQTKLAQKKMHILNKLTAAAAAMLSLCMPAEAAMSGFSQAFGEIYLPDARAALEIYIGRWDGAQKLFFNGQELGEGTFNQTCVARGNDADMRVVSTGRIAYGAQSALSRSVTFIDRDGKLRVDVIGEDGDVATYYGTIERNRVTWLPKHLIMTLDVQTDSFFVSEKGVTMICEGLRFIRTPNKTGILGTSTILKKMSGRFETDKLSPSGGAGFGSAGARLE